MLRIIRVSILLGLLITALVGIGACANTTAIDVLSVEGDITPDLADYIRRGIEYAEEHKAVACVIELDTSGGFDTAMRNIIKDILNAQVPVVVYVSPSGARAASAGVFITLAAHVAAMAPNTAIGASSVVLIGAGGEQEISETMQEKILNDATAYIRSIAEFQGRNIKWAEQAVREGVSATEREALELNVIDVVASDLGALVSQLDGREVALLGGRVVTLDTQSAIINFIHNGSDK